MRPRSRSSPRGSLALGALNAYLGDALAAEGSELALAMTLRHRGADLPLERVELARTLPDAGPRVAIFVHGLGETDASWRLRADARRPGYGAGLRRDLGHTPIELRYNSGRHISDNGRALAALLEELHAAWPVAIEEIVIVGHSMGGLVARSACHYGHADGHAWTRAVRHVFCLGSPHLGAPLEKGVNALRLGARPPARDARPRRRAQRAQRRDQGPALRLVREEDWCDCDPDELLTDRCTDVPFLPGARFYFVAATLSRRPGAPLGAILGDLLVRVPERIGRGPGAQARLRDRGRPPPGRPDALRPAQPPRGVRTDQGLDRAMSDRERLLARLRDAGVDEDEIERAAAEERLPTLAVELALGGAGRHSLSHVARESGLPPAFLRELMQAVGRPSPGRGERIFTDEDIETARVIKRFVDAGLPRRELLEVGRVLGQGMAHTSEAVRRLVGNALLEPGDSEYTVGLRFAQAADELAPLVPTLLDHQFRAHLRDGMRRELVTESEREVGRLAGTRDVAIAFADLVGLHAAGRPPARRGPGLARRALRRPGGGRGQAPRDAGQDDRRRGDVRLARGPAAHRQPPETRRGGHGGGRALPRRARRRRLRAGHRPRRRLVRRHGQRCEPRDGARAAGADPRHRAGARPRARRDVAPPPPTREPQGRRRPRAPLLARRRLGLPAS